MNQKETNEALKGLWERQHLERAKGMVRSMECMKETDTTLYRITKFFVTAWRALLAFVSISVRRAER